MFSQDLCEYHQNNVDITVILTGRSQGHGLRWATEFWKAQSSSTDSCVKQLERHLLDAKKAKGFAAANIMKMSDDEIEGYVRCLRSYGDAMPTNETAFSTACWRST